MSQIPDVQHLIEESIVIPVHPGAALSRDFTGMRNLFHSIRLYIVNYTKMCIRDSPDSF